jgi:hypothetical protein
MWAEDNPDVDFEDKEARYERMGRDREELRNLRTSGKKLSGILNKHRWVGAMLMDDEENPLVWMAKNGIDITAALDDPEVKQRVADAFSAWEQGQAAGEAAAAAVAAIESAKAAAGEAAGNAADAEAGETVAEAASENAEARAGETVVEAASENAGAEADAINLEAEAAADTVAGEAAGDTAKTAADQPL